MGIQFSQVNDVTTTLNGAINNSTTSITVSSGSNFPAAPFAIRIDSEIMQVTSTGTGTNWTVTRASESVNGAATAASHANGATVFQAATAAAWNALVQLQTGTLTSQPGSIQLTSGRVNIDSSGTGAAGLAINSTDGQAISAIVSGSAGAIFISATSGRGIDLTSTGNDGIVASTNAGAHYALEGINAASSDGAGAAGKLDGGTHTNGLQVVNNHATKETVNATNSGAGSAGVFANNGANATLTLTNSGGGPGLSTPNTKINGVLYTVDTFANRPGSPATGDIHYATDRHIEYYYDGTRWLSTFTRTSPLTAFSAFVNNVAATANASMRTGVLDPTYGYYVESLVFTFHVLTTFDATNRWTITLNKTNSAAASAAVLTSQALWQTGRAINVEYADSFAINTAYLVTDAYQWFLDLTKVNAPGNLAVVGTYLIYRLVG